MTTWEWWRARGREPGIAPRGTACAELTPEQQAPGFWTKGRPEIHVFQFRNVLTCLGEETKLRSGSDGKALGVLKI